MKTTIALCGATALVLTITMSAVAIPEAPSRNAVAAPDSGEYDAADYGAAHYGSGIELEESTPIDRLLADPDAYVGKVVRVDGTVLDVCPAKGCWMELGTDAGKVKIKVEDDVIVFPADAKGRPATAEGVFEAIEMDRERYVGWLRHLAEERGETFDPATVGDGPYRVFQIRGTGATIESEGPGATDASD